MTVLTESLDYLDMEDQIKDVVTVDEYAAKMGPDKEIITITFTVGSKLAAEDLVSWFERGYDWVLDASVSDGEIESGKWLVFVEMKRRSAAPERIITLLTDLETLTGMKLEDWTVEVEGTEVEADKEQIGKILILNPNEYEEIKGESDSHDEEKASEEGDAELNEFRNLAGLETKSVYEEDEYIKNLKAMAGM